MRTLLRASIVIALIGCGGDKPNAPVDALVDVIVNPTCNPIAQQGCEANEKCTWIIDQVAPTEVGHIGCAPLDGTEVAVGGACEEGPPGPQGFDNCAKGSVCVGLECKTICDPQASGTATGCPEDFLCSRYADLFDVGTTIVAGACDPECDPLNQNLLVGSMAPACGSPDPAAPIKGCFSFDFIQFYCAPVNAANLAKTDRVEPALAPNGNAFINGCAPGYVPFFIEMTGSMKVICSGLCTADNISSQLTPVDEVQNATGIPNGSAKLVTQPAPRPGDGNCVASEKGSASGGPQNCVMIWTFLADPNGTPAPSPYNETVGLCFSHNQYQYDSNNDMVPDRMFPSCQSLPKRNKAGGGGNVLTPGIDDDAADFGCQKIADSPFELQGTAPLMRDFRLGPISGALTQRR